MAFKIPNLKRAGMTERDYARFISKIDTTGECWLWTAPLIGGGYGRLLLAGRRYMAHRLSFMLWNGDIDKPCVCHTCDNPSCCNPTHLFLGTQADNIADMVAKGRHIKGHIVVGLKTSGELSGSAKLTWAKVSEIRASTDTNKVLAERYGVDQSNISVIRSGKSWRSAS